MFYSNKTIALLFVFTLFTLFFAHAQQQTSAKKLVSLGIANTKGYTGKTAFIVTDAATNLSYELHSTPNDLGSIYGKFLTCNPINNKIYMADVGDGISTEITEWELSENAIKQQNKFVIKNRIITHFDFDNKGNLFSLENYNSRSKEAILVQYKLSDKAAVILNEKKISFIYDNVTCNLNSGDITILPDGKMYALFSGSNSVLYEIKNYTGKNEINAQAVYLNTIPEYCYSLYSQNNKVIAGGNTLQSQNYSYAYVPEGNSFIKYNGNNSGYLLFESVSVNAELKDKPSTVANIKLTKSSDVDCMELAGDVGNSFVLEILNSMGEKVIPETINQTRFSTRNLASGVYFAKISYVSGAAETTIFCVSR